MEKSNVVIRTDFKKYVEIERNGKNFKVNLITKEVMESSTAKKLIEIYSITDKFLPSEVKTTYKDFNQKDIDSSNNLFLKGLISLSNQLTHKLSAQVNEIREIWNGLEIKK